MNAPKRILLVEDSARDAELILGALEPHQLAGEVVHVRDGAEALDYLYRRGAFASLKMIPIVMMTSSRQEQDLIRSYELGVNAYVVKPMKFQDFVEAVKQVSGFWAVINEVPGSLGRSESPSAQPPPTNVKT
jgi:CheY-like chemotaxis protein